MSSAVTRRCESSTVSRKGNWASALAAVVLIIASRMGLIVSRIEARIVATAALAVFCAVNVAHAHTMHKGGFFLPNADNAKIVTVSATGEAAAGITVITQAVAEKETGPREAVKKFGEIYEFVPQFIAVHRDEPTKIEFWNLQGDDEHDLALLDADLNVLMYEKLPTLKKTSWVFTFHREGLFGFKCLVHQPEMSGQILVLPPSAH